MGQDLWSEILYKQFVIYYDEVSFNSLDIVI